MLLNYCITNYSGAGACKISEITIFNVIKKLNKYKKEFIQWIIEEFIE